MSPSTPRIPLVFISGFLGAGKTTFLRTLLPQLNRLGVPASVILNDFANAEVDAALLRPLNANLRAITGSCVCCGSQREFLDALRTADVPENGVLLVEVNGTSDMQELIGSVGMRHEAERFLPPTQFTLVDAERWQTRGWHDDLECEQVKSSTHWRMTRRDSVSPEHVARVRCLVHSLAPRALETNAERFAEELQALVQRRIQPFPTALIVPPQAHQHHHAHERAFTAVQVPLPWMVRKHELATLLDSLPDRVLRVKGWCRIEEMPQFPMSIQHVRPKSQTTFLPMLSAASADPVAVVIGVMLPVDRIRAQFAALPSAEKAPDFVPFAA